MNAGAASRPPGTADPLVEWSCYRRLAELPVEAMRAHFVRHVYDRHSHDAYSFGVTERGVQAFRCRGGTRASAAGMIMAFNPDDPHDGHAAGSDGFTYAMLHLGTDLVADILADAQGRPTRATSPVGSVGPTGSPHASTSKAGASRRPGLDAGQLGDWSASAEA